MNQKELKNKADKAATSTKKFFNQLKKSKPKQLDEFFEELHDETFKETDCLSCANCCKTISPIFTQRDIERLAQHFKVRPATFVERYLHIDEEQDYVLNSSPCPFLGADNYCSVYDYRPIACREYPHTNRKKMIQILDLTLKNTYTCPAVFTIVEQLKKSPFTR